MDIKSFDNPVSGYDNQNNKRGRTAGPAKPNIKANQRNDSLTTYSLKNEGKTHSPGGSSKSY